jgi:DNA phosphorothioation-associated putative methyltransferase
MVLQSNLKTPFVERHRTALRRTSLSRPLRLAVEQGIIVAGLTVFDFGCGHGDDIANLQTLGIASTGWDPVHRPGSPRVPSDVVNLGFVVNVIEDRDERTATLLSAWALATRCLIISAQLTRDAVTSPVAEMNDGVLTRLNTFQKYFEHSELKLWVESALETRVVSLAPGVLCVFKDEALEESFSVRQFRSRITVPRIRRSSSLYEQHRDLFDGLAAFVASRGRLPADTEFERSAELRSVAGSFKRAFQVIQSLGTAGEWELIRTRRTDDLLVYMALAAFNKLPRWSMVPQDTQLDIAAFFGTYAKARERSSELLFSAGNNVVINSACIASTVGKLTPSALYVHQTALDRLSPPLRVLEGCARILVGQVDGANLVKLHRHEHRVSYLAYPKFDEDPHPRLERSVVVDLQRLNETFLDYRLRTNPPILHRKETFVADDYPGVGKFRTLTRQEEAHSLLTETYTIGTADGWKAALEARGLALRGHRLVKAKVPEEKK